MSKVEGPRREITLTVEAEHHCPVFQPGGKMVIRLPELDTSSGPICLYAAAQALPVLVSAVSAGEDPAQRLPRFRCIAGGDRHADFTVSTSEYVAAAETGAAMHLRNVSFLAGLPPSLMEALVAALRRDQYFPRSTLLEQGKPADRLVIIDKGVAELVRVEETGFERTLAKMGPGEVAGETGFLRDGRNNATLRCVTTVQASVLLKRDLVSLARRLPELVRHLEKHR